MNKSVLVLEENSIIHGLVASALDLDGLSLHHEFDPEEYVQRARALQPDLILISNADQERDYSVLRSLSEERGFATVPRVLLANSRDRLDPEALQRLHVDGVVRKPFEASDLQQQVSKHLNLVDLIGSAYDYKKSQSLRDEGINPLADMEVLDRDILDILRGAPETATRGGPVPDVDFGPELATEQAAAAPPAGEPAGAGADVEAPVEEAGEAGFVDETTLEETLEPERAFEFVGEPTPGLADREAEAARSLLDEDLPLQGHDFDEGAAREAEGGFGPHATAEEAAATEAEEMAAQEEAGLEELGAPDLLEEEAEAEAAMRPQPFDQDLEGGEAREAEPRLDEVEMELSGAEIDFEGVGEDLDSGRVEMFEADLEEEPRPAARQEEDIPEAVRRMVELRPVLSMGGEQEEVTGAEGIEEPEEVFPIREEHLDRMAEELDQLDEFEVGERVEAAAGPEPEAGGAGADEEEFFHEDYLGDDEIDEERIQRALAAEPAPERDEFVAEALEDADLRELDELEGLDLEAAPPGPEETPAEREEAAAGPAEATGEAAPAEFPGEDELSEEARALEAGAFDFGQPELEAAEEAAGPEDASLQEAEDSLLDQQLDALEEAARGESAEAEAVMGPAEEPPPWAEAPGEAAWEAPAEEWAGEERQAPAMAQAATEEAVIEEAAVEEAALEEASAEWPSAEEATVEELAAEEPPMEEATVEELAAEEATTEAPAAEEAAPGAAEAEGPTAWAAETGPAPEDEAAAVAGAEAGDELEGFSFEEEPAPEGEEAEAATTFGMEEAEAEPGDEITLDDEELSIEFGAEAEQDWFGTEPGLESPPEEPAAEAGAAPAAEGGEAAWPPLEEERAEPAGVQDLSGWEETAAGAPGDIAWDEPRAEAEQGPAGDEDLSGWEETAAGAPGDIAWDEPRAGAEQGPAGGEDLSGWEETAAEEGGLPAEEAPPAAAMAAFGEPETAEPELAGPDDEIIGGTGFDEAFRELQSEIESHPQGERLDDVLAREGVMEAVEAIDFQIPQHEHTFTRAMGLLEVPGEGSVSAGLLERMRQGQPAPAAAVAGPVARAATQAGREAAEAALGAGESVPSEELLHMIESSVRRVVNEEMPKYFERWRDLNKA